MTTLGIEASIEAAALTGWEDPQQFWAHFTDPEMWPAERLFFELYVRALYGGPGTEGFFAASVEAWITALTGEAVKAGLDEATARVQAIRPLSAWRTQRPLASHILGS